MKWLKDPATITFEITDYVASITLNRPERRNAVTLQTLTELHDALLEADDRTSVRCVVIQGAGKDFCSGADMSGQDPADGYDPADYRTFGSFDDDIWQVERRAALRLAIFKMHKPVIAKVHGNCLAVGTDIALNCDMVIASTDARIGFPAVRALGSPANHMWLYLVGPQWAKRLLLTGDVMRGEDAARIGLVLQAVPPDELDAEVDRMARRIALMDPELAAAQKRIVNAGLELMGWDVLQRLAAENDVRAHQSRAMAGFMNVVRTDGFKEAVRRRDEPYGPGEVPSDRS